MSVEWNLNRVEDITVFVSTAPVVVLLIQVPETGTDLLQVLFV